MTTWFTADTHFGHRRICELENRPFGTPSPPDATDEEKKANSIVRCAIMDQAIVENWNRYVDHRDTVYHLGDWAFHNPEKYLEQLNGNIHLIFGNHDDKCAKKIKERFGSYHDMLYLHLNGYLIHLCHYKLQVWRSNYRGSWHLHGHSHGGLKYVNQKALDVGIMTKGWNPERCWLWSFDQLEAYRSQMPASPHHDHVLEE